MIAWRCFFDRSIEGPYRIWTGQHENIGSALYSEDSGGTITILLDHCWELNPVNVILDPDTHEVISEETIEEAVSKGQPLFFAKIWSFQNLFRNFFVVDDLILRWMHKLNFHSW